MMTQPRRFSREFKLAVVRQVESGEQRAAQVCRAPARRAPTAALAAGGRAAQRPAAGLIHYSDRGVQYASRAT